MSAIAVPTGPETGHTLSARHVLEEWQVTAKGLPDATAAERLDQYGPNRLPRSPATSIATILLRQFASPLIVILLVAAGVALAAEPEHPTDAIFIAIVLALNALIGGFQEWKAERSSRALEQLLQVRATVVRDGEVSEIDGEQVVPGDLVLLESGNRVPADLRLTGTQGLEIDESLLTGESVPVAKDADAVAQSGTPLAERTNMAFAGSIVARGRGRGVVVATGAHTSVGKLALDMISTQGGQPPLMDRMASFSRTVAWSVLIAIAVLAMLGVLIRGYTISDMFLFGVAMAVGAIPEGLPVALTVALAIATSRMARRGVIVRRLAAVEGLGSCTLIASDKTGTLTCNELTVRVIELDNGTQLQVTGEGFAPLGEVTCQGQPATVDQQDQLANFIRVAVLCNEADLYQKQGDWRWRGDPTDVALLAMAHKLGVARFEAIDKAPQTGEIPFEPERQFAATFHTTSTGTLVCVKGAPERVIEMCQLSAPARQDKLERGRQLAEQGYRVLALAEGIGSSSTAEPTELDFLGFVGLIDPLRPGVAEAVIACQQAGIEVCMVTGDHPVTALAISRQLGLAHEPQQVITGAELEAIPQDQWPALVERTRVFARTTPRQKLDLVAAARQAGHYVAVTGDGVNDAPALRQANIGLAMGRSGTDVAREAAELVVTDDNFATIVAGVEEGRVAYDNVRKVVYLLISTGAAEVILLGLAILTGWPSGDAGAAILPLLPAQLLWLNLVTNGIQDVALAFEPGERDVLKRRPRPPSERIFNRLMITRVLLAAVTMGLVAYFTFGVMVDVVGWSVDRARNNLLLLMVLFEIFHIGNCRSETVSAFKIPPWTNPILLGGSALAFGLHLLAMHWGPTQSVLGVAPLALNDFLLMGTLASSVLVVIELNKGSGLFSRPATRPERTAEP